MKTAALILTIAAALSGCGSSDPSTWPPSPPVRSYEAHKPWGDNWHRETR